MLKFNQLLATVKSTRPMTASNPLNIDIHCLIVDASEESVTAADSTHGATLAQALAFADQGRNKDPDSPEKLHQLVKQWISPVEFNTVYAGDKRLHINFPSLSTMAQAMELFPFLVRCGSLNTSYSGQGWSSTHCVACDKGDKHTLPELLHLSCVLVNKTADSVKREEVIKFLKEEVQLKYSTFWLPGKSPKDGGRDQNRFSVYVVPRMVEMEKLQREVERIHLQFQFLGTKIRVQGVNSKLLRRCAQCQQLGHEENACIVYSGVALRLLGKSPFPHQAMLELQQRTQAKVAFLGSTVDERRPSRRLTLLFDAEAWSDEKAERLKKVLSETFGDNSTLHEDPKAINVRQRHQECKDFTSQVV
jgi:hypothetical protein